MVVREKVKEYVSVFKLVATHPFFIISIGVELGLAIVLTICSIFTPQLLTILVPIYIFTTCVISVILVLVALDVYFRKISLFEKLGIKTIELRKRKYLR